MMDRGEDVTVMQQLLLMLSLREETSGKNDLEGRRTIGNESKFGKQDHLLVSYLGV